MFGTKISTKIAYTTTSSIKVKNTQIRGMTSAHAFPTVCQPLPYAYITKHTRLFALKTYSPNGPFPPYLRPKVPKPRYYLEIPLRSPLRNYRAHCLTGATYLFNLLEWLPPVIHAKNTQKTPKFTKFTVFSWAAYSTRQNAKLTLIPP